MNEKLIKKTVSEIAVEIGVALKYIQAAYNFREHRWNCAWVPGPEVYQIFWNSKPSYGSHRSYTEVDGERIWKDGSHLTEEQRDSMAKAIAAVEAYEKQRRDTIKALWKEGYQTLLKALLSEQGLDLDSLTVKLFDNDGGMLNTGNGIHVEEVDDWTVANAAVFADQKGKIVAAFDGSTSVGSFFSGYGLGNSNRVRRWVVGNNINQDIRRWHD